MFILKHLFLKNRKQPMRKRFAATALDMHYGGTEQRSIFTTSTNMKTAQESVKSLMVVSITKHLRMRILVPKRK